VLLQRMAARELLLEMLLDNLRGCRELRHNQHVKRSLESRQIHSQQKAKSLKWLLLPALPKNALDLLWTTR